jgi:hypothetical protein
LTPSASLTHSASLTPSVSLTPSASLTPSTSLALNGGNKKYDDLILKRKLKKYNHKMNKIINMNGGSVDTMNYINGTTHQPNKEHHQPNNNDQPNNNEKQPINNEQQPNKDQQQPNNNEQQILEKVEGLNELKKSKLLKTVKNMKLVKDKLVMNEILRELSKYKNKSYDDALTFILTKIELRIEEQQLLKIYYNKKELALDNFLKMFPDAGEKFGLGDAQIIETLNFSLKENTHVYTNVQTYYEFNDGEVQKLIHINSAKESANILFDTSYIYTDKNIYVVNTFATIINLLMYEALK